MKGLVCIFLAIFIVSTSVVDATYVYCSNGEVCYEGTTCCYNQLTHENQCWLAPNAICCPYGGSCYAGWYCTGRTFPDNDLCAPISSTRAVAGTVSSMMTPPKLVGPAKKLEKINEL